MNHKRRAVAVSGIMLLIVLAFCLWLGCQDFPQQLQRLPDGNFLRVIGVTQARKPKIETGAPLLRLFASVIPYDYHEQLGFGTWSSDTNPLSVWVRFGKAFSPDSPMARVNGVLRVLDEDGNCSARRLGSLYDYDYHPVYNITPDYFPRRGKELRLELWSEDGARHLEHLARFTVTNPLARDYPIWKAAPLPDRQADRGLVATLERLETGVPDGKTQPSLHGRELLESGQPVSTLAALSLQQAGRPTDGWIVESISLRDATGNLLSPDEVQEERSPGRVVIRLPVNLWAESAWKLDAVFRRLQKPRAYGRRDLYVAPPQETTATSTSPTRRRFTFQVRPTIH